MNEKRKKKNQIIRIILTLDDKNAQHKKFPPQYRSRKLSRAISTSLASISSSSSSLPQTFSIFSLRYKFYSPIS